MCKHEADYFIILEGTRRGLYCSECGKWIKWLGKDEYNLYLNKGVNVVDRRTHNRGL